MSSRSVATHPVPVVIAHFGRAPDELKVALESAAAFNERVVLIGDESNLEAWRDHWDSSRSAMPKFAEFRRSYVKMSDYPEFYEMAFWRRHFAIEEWMEEEGIERAFVLDSDVVTFVDYGSEVLPRLPEESVAGLMTEKDQPPFAWASSMHFSYWTLEALRDFATFCIDAYRDPEIRRDLESKYRWHREGRRPGGICEMTLLYFWQQRREWKVANLAEVCRGMVGDMAVGMSSNQVQHEYAMRLGLKRLRFRSGIPYGRNLLSGEEVQFACVHCQGQFKPVMRLLSPGPMQRFYAERYRMERAVLAVRWRVSKIVRRLLRPLRANGFTAAPPR